MTFPILMLTHLSFCVSCTVLVLADRELLPRNGTLKRDGVIPTFLRRASLGFARAAMQLGVGKWSWHWQGGCPAMFPGGLHQLYFIHSSTFSEGEQRNESTFELPS